MDKKDILKKYVCTQPFRYIDIQDNGDFVCCPSWCSTNIRDGNEMNWMSDNAISVRKSVLDGSYSHCDHIVCPSLSNLINNGKPSGIFIPTERFKEIYNIETLEDVKNIKNTPEEILFGFDRSCNFKCPSCRLELIPNSKENSPEHERKLKILKYIEDNFAKSAKKLLITGSGDPFYSKIYREYLQNFDETKYPNIENIQIITNGKMLNEKMWNSLKAKKYIKSIEVSIDAGTKETYENVTRLNGDWDVLISNLKFMSTIPTINDMILSMVVSELNFTEMFTFYELINSIFDGKKYKTLSINFRQHIHWGTGKYSIKDVEKMQVFNPTHPKFRLFIDELKKIHNKPYVSHNFNHLNDMIEKSLI
jgi:MoaA/NifB/PqqE/SkfB family radical SAM enzyme